MHAMGRKSCEIFSSKRMYVEHDYVWITNIQLVMSQHADLKSDLLDLHNGLQGQEKAISSLYQSELG